MTPLYNCPVPQFPHLSNVPSAVPAHRAAGTNTGADRKWGEAQEREGKKEVHTQQGTTKPQVTLTPYTPVYNVG